MILCLMMKVQAAGYYYCCYQTFSGSGYYYCRIWPGLMKTDLRCRKKYFPYYFLKDCYFRNRCFEKYRYPLRTVLPLPPVFQVRQAFLPLPLQPFLRSLPEPLLYAGQGRKLQTALILSAYPVRPVLQGLLPAAFPVQQDQTPALHL